MRLFKLTEREKYVWNEHFTACLNNIYSYVLYL